MADVIPIVRTKTVSIGDGNVTLGVVRREATATGALRWKKDGILMENWNNKAVILFENISSDDDGIYECYKQNQQNERIKHAFMQLIVRECPHNKWSPTDCTKDCEVCYNGGVCDTYIGTCICPSGFYGKRCVKSAGDNRFGRDGQIPCKSNNGGSCIGNLFCPPLPQGCACHAGWKGLDCRT
ncbi:tyrosine-protein kinase receptor Tie-1-like, partial [Anneissia japonica]|uniref:tyrosine-protein kinase receptor Tie-1-like n=1 Tax=Anneissia japonica TaxID=1529436 RepID=UPI001425781C